MRHVLGLILFLLIIGINPSLSQQGIGPIVDKEMIFQEKNGIIRVEAEHFVSQDLSDVRAWYHINADSSPKIFVDPDAKHLSNAGSNGYIEILPDSRTTHGEELIAGINFCPEPGKMAIVHYPIYFKSPGKYYVWVRTYSTGSEDNGIHVGINGAWPESGRRMQWCEGKNEWTWASKQRTKEQHCGVPHQIYLMVSEEGLHTVSFSMREDGFEMDQFILTTDRAFVPSDENLPKILTKNGVLPTLPPKVMEDKKKPLDIFQLAQKIEKKSKVMRAINFDIKDSGYYIHTDWLAIHPEKHQNAKAKDNFPFPSGNYDVIFVAVGENDGQSTYHLYKEDKELRTYTPPLSSEMFEEGKDYCLLLENIHFEKGESIEVQAFIGSADGKEFTRARWKGIIFTPFGRGSTVLLGL